MSAIDFTRRRRTLVRGEIAGVVRDETVLAAMERVPREKFVPPELREDAYLNRPLPIGLGQTISQPLVVGMMAEAMRLAPGDRVLEVGTGSGYAAAVIAEAVGDQSEVYTIERHAELADSARERLATAGYGHVHVTHGDGTLGWPRHAPFDAITVAAGGPRVPPALKDQLAPGGRLVVPVGDREYGQKLLRVTRTGDDAFQEEDLGPVAFVPLVGRQGWTDGKSNPAPPVEETSDPTNATTSDALGSRDGSRGYQERKNPQTHDDLPATPVAASAPSTIKPSSPSDVVRASAEPFDAIDTVDLDPLLDRIGEARVVLIGEATHGTSEFYRLRAQITKRLVADRGFDIVAVEADWPDAARINDHVTRRSPGEGPAWQAFGRFPTWMWRNHETLAFIDWLRDHNLQRRPDPTARCGFYGLDLYNLNASIRAVLDYLDKVDPETAKVARERYGCLTPYQDDPATYGRATLTGRYRECEEDVVGMLRELLTKQAEYTRRDGELFMDAALNAKLVADAERYYRVMYYGGAASWNHRDTHMVETLEQLLAYRGPKSKAVVWAHNSHLGDATATGMGARGEVNVGSLSRERFGDDAYLIGQLTHTGTVAAASYWDEDMEVKAVNPSRPDSYERLLHDSGTPRFLLPLRRPNHADLRETLRPTRLERAIGVIYRPETERQSHYFDATLPDQFDEVAWFDETTALRAITPQEARVHPPTHPFAAID